MEDADVEALRAAGWNDRAIYEATALISYFNFTGRMEAASGLPQDQIPLESRFREGRVDRRRTSGR